METQRRKHPARRLLAGFLACLAAVAAEADTITVAVAANFAATLRDVAAAFETASGHEVRLVSGSSGKIYAQVVHGAPFHAFFSADRDKPAALEARGLAVAGSRYTYATGRLVLWSAGAGVVDDAGRVLTEGHYEKLALANPALAPYGTAAVEVLRNLHLEQASRARWVLGENIAQTYQFVASGNAQLGFVALAQVLQHGGDDSGSAWRVPGDLYSPIRQDAVLLQHGAHNRAARALLQFVREPGARAIIAAHGYGTAEE